MLKVHERMLEACTDAHVDDGGMMPKGPNGEKRPADMIGCAVSVARVSVGEAEDDRYSTPARARSGRAGGGARAARLSPE